MAEEKKITTTVTVKPIAKAVAAKVEEQKAEAAKAAAPVVAKVEEKKVEAPKAAAPEVAEAKEVIPEEEVPLAAADQSKMNWWWLLVVLVLGTTGAELYRRHMVKKNAEASKTTK